MNLLNTISPKALHDLIETTPNAEVLDVRTKVEFASIRAAIAKNLPLDEIRVDKLAQNSKTSKESSIYLLCERGSRAAVAAGHFKAAGFSNVFVVEGGTQAWIAGGYPVVSSGKKVISIERQVRIGAGSLVLLGVVLTLLITPYFIILSGFVGAGLLFAGITDWCGMGLLLARAPWNR